MGSMCTWQMLENREIIRKQVDEIGVRALQTKFHCGRCGEVCMIWHGSRCLECGVWFCDVCAKEHYGMGPRSGGDNVSKAKRVEALRLRVQNYKRIGATPVTIDLSDGEIHEIRGDTDSGKTSILDSLDALVSEYVPTSMVHRGADKAEIVLELDEATIERVIPAEGEAGRRKIGTTLVTTREGHAIKDGSAFVRSIFGRGGFHPMDFVRLGMGDPKGRTERLREQRRMLLSALPVSLSGEDVALRVKALGEDVFAAMDEVDLGGLDFEQSAYLVCESIERACSVRFAEENAEYERAKGRIELTPAPEHMAPKRSQAECDGAVESALQLLAGARERQKGIAGRAAQRDRLRQEVEAAESELPELGALRRTTEAYEKQCEELTSEIGGISDQIAALQKQLAEKNGALSEALKKRERCRQLQRDVAAQEARKKDLEVLERELSSTGQVEDLEGLRVALEEARGDAESRRLQDAHDANAAVLAEAKWSAQTFGSLVRLFRDVIPKEILSTADLGVEGLTLDEDQLYVGPDPLNQLGTSAQMVVAVKLAAGMNPRIPFILLDGAESLGSEDRKTLGQAAHDLGLKPIMTYVDPGAKPGPGVTVMENGAAKSA